ncbi:MAG: B12-binding domain-containing radical SAM protein [Nitrospirae bacterium]|nr:B12-binding domain-containing radical SAM protein [Nitrospirota bacterium]
MTSRTIHLINVAAPFRVGLEDMTRPPSGILYVGGNLKKHGFNVKIHHIRESEISSAVEEIVSDESVLFIGFSLMTGKQITLSSRMSLVLKTRKPELKIVWGGIHPSLMPEECLKFAFVDYVIIGEGETTALELAGYLLRDATNPPNDINGLAFIKKNETVITPMRSFETEVDNFRQDWSLIEINKYVRKNKTDMNFCFITSRGCPHSCGFCYNQKFNMRKWRAHSIDVVVHELTQIKEKTGINSVTFDDDNFFTNKKRGLEILRRLKDNGIICQWVDLRVDYISEDFISQLVDLGVEAIFMGWESGNKKTLEKIAKKFTPALILEKTRILSKFKKLTVDASGIVGFPWEDEKDIKETIFFVLKMFKANPFRLNFNIGIYVPYPGAPINTESFKKSFSFPEGYEDWSKFDILAGTMELPWLGREQIKRITLIDNYAKLLFIFPKSSVVVKFFALVFAMLSFIRLQTGIFVCPFEIWIANYYQKIKLRRFQN